MSDRTTGVERLAARRLLVLSSVIVGLLLLPAAANASIAQVFGTVTCTEQGAGASEGQRWCGNSANTTVPTWDGTPIDISVAFPPATGGDNNYPIVGIYHGWGGTKITPSSSTAQRWLKLGMQSSACPTVAGAPPAEGRPNPRTASRPRRANTDIST